MKKLIIIILLVFTASFSFAETLTYTGSTDTMPKILQGEWTEVAVSQNKGGTWIDGISVPFKITDTTFSAGNFECTVLGVNSYKDDAGRIGYLVKVADVPDLFEFWFEDGENVVLVVHRDRVESLRCQLVR